MALDKGRREERKQQGIGAGQRQMDTGGDLQQGHKRARSGTEEGNGASEPERPALRKLKGRAMLPVRPPPLPGLAGGAPRVSTPTKPSTPSPTLTPTHDDRSEEMDSEDLAKLTKTELQARLRDKGLPVSGTKAQAIGKLRKEARSQSTLSRFAGFMTSSPAKLVNWIHTARASARGVSDEDSDAAKDADGGTYYDLTGGPTGATGAPSVRPQVGPIEVSEEEPAEAEQHREAADAADGGAEEEDGERHGQDEGLAPAEGASSQQ